MESKEQSFKKPNHQRFKSWDNVEDYKHVLRQMFGDFGTKDFLNRKYCNE